MSPPQAKGVWSTSEHERFLEAVATFPHGPWSVITDFIGTRSVKQVQTHAQKYQHKVRRHQRGLLKRKTKSSRLEHRVDQTAADHLTNGSISRPGSRSSSAASSVGSPYSSLVHHSHTRKSMEAPVVDEALISFPHSCSSPSGLDDLLVNIEPMPFYGCAMEQELYAPTEPFEFLMACGLLDV